jgi:non-heme chloroperoxidase
VGLEQTLKMCAVSFSEEARRIRVPTVVLAGTDDPLLPPEVVRSTVSSQISGARQVALSCGHEIPQEMPEQTAAIVEAFLSGLGARSAEAAEGGTESS